MIFGILANKSADIFMKETDARLSNNDFSKNPFNGGIRAMSIDEHSSLYICKLEPLYPNFTYIGLIPMSLAFWFGFNWVFYLGLVIVCFGFFWSRWFYILMLWFGLRKAGYRGLFKVVSMKNMIDKLCF